MKKLLMILTVLVMLLFITSCLNYKAYDVEDETTEEVVEGEEEEEVDLIDEIAEIERQLEENDLVTDEEEMEEEEVIVVEEEVVVPILEEAEIISGDVLVFEVNENEMLKLNVNIMDPDNDEVTHTFTPPLNNFGEWETSYGDAGEYYVTLTATDQIHTTTQEILVVVNRVNVAPEVDFVADMYYEEGDIIRFELEVSDPNNDPVTLMISEPLKSGTFTTDHTSAGTYEIVVTANDGELETTTSFMLYIDNVNELPMIEGLDDIEAEEGDTIIVEPILSDLDGDEIEITISDPVGDDGVWETGYTDNGVYEITVTATDGQDTVTESITVTIEDVNMPPEILDVIADVN